MVSKLPSARSLSKASREGDLSENMANADMSASLKKCPDRSGDNLGCWQSRFEPSQRAHRRKDACVLEGQRWTWQNPLMRTSKRSSERGIFALMFTKRQPG